MIQFRKHQPAFTIVEMLVAVAITTMLLSLIFQLFASTQRAVSRGIKTGEILVESETIGNQIERDGESKRTQMLGPDATNGGFLVIVQKRLIDVPMRKSGDPSYVAPEVRSDQLMFISSASASPEFQALTPRKDNQLSSDISANHARIWYGHALRTAAEGTSADMLATPGSPNEYANEWVLARQGLLLTDTTAPPPSFDPTSDIYAQAPADPTTDPTAAMWNASVNVPGSITDAPAPPQLFHGFTDVAEQGYENDPLLSVIDDLNDPGKVYPDVALPYAVPAERPWVNTSPGVGNQHIEQNFEAWRVGQMHMALANNVSDIIVEFAGDYDDDTDPTILNGPDGRIDKYVDATGNENIRWYTHHELANNDNPDNGVAAHDPRRPTTWSLKDDSGNLQAGFTTIENTPANEAYYTEPGSSIADAILVFRHDDDQAYDDVAGTNSKWPYLIRIRYRLHDSRGYIGSSMPDPSGGGDWLDQRGQWFEHVIRVNRP